MEYCSHDIVTFLLESFVPFLTIILITCILDIKPWNILLTESGFPKRLILDQLCTLRNWIELAGFWNTVLEHLAPPEMLDFKPHIHMARMDLWCLGATFFQMMTRRRPF